MTPDQFTSRAKWIVNTYRNDPEKLRSRMADLMEETLEKIGYSKGIGYYKQAMEEGAQ